jgi:predicted deacylase
MDSTALPAAYPIELPWPSLTPWKSGNTGTPYVFEWAAEAPGPTAMLCALTHGNEVSGALVLDDLLRSGLRPRRGRLILSFNNVAAFERFDPAQPDRSRFVDEDLNRLWAPSVLDGPRQSVELQRARALRPFVERADVLIDLHSMHEQAPPMMVCGWEDKGVRFAQSVGAPLHLMCDRGHAQGVRLRDYQDFANPRSPKQALLLEAGQHWELAALTVARDVTARGLVASGVVGEDDVPRGWRQPNVGKQRVVRVAQAVVATSTAFTFAQPFRGFEVLAQGALIGREPQSLARSTPGQPEVSRGPWREVRAPFDQCVLVMPSQRHAAPGVTVVRLATMHDAA